MPGKSYTGPLPPLSAVDQALVVRLRKHVESLAAKERNTDLDTPARYIAAAFAEYGLEPVTQDFPSGGRTVRNIEVQAKTDSLVVVGAHYDTVPGSPGADDNASAVAALIELAGMLASEELPVRFVAFANEELPYFMGPEMGSWNSARRSRERKESVRAMLSLEMLGYYRDEPRSQHYPPPLGLFYPDRANFIAFVGDLGARGLVRQCVSLFRKHAKFPSQGVAAPSTYIIHIAPALHRSSGGRQPAARRVGPIRECASVTRSPSGTWLSAASASSWRALPRSSSAYLAKP